MPECFTTLNSGRILKEILRKRISLTWGWPETYVQWLLLFKYWTGRSKLSSADCSNLCITVYKVFFLIFWTKFADPEINAKFDSKTHLIKLFFVISGHFFYVLLCNLTAKNFWYKLNGVFIFIQFLYELFCNYFNGFDINNTF